MEETGRSFYDFALALKRRHKEIKDKPVEEVGYTLKYIPWVLQQTAEIYNKHHKKYDFNELLSVAFTACAKCERNFKADKGAFTGYAEKYLEGALNAYVSNLTRTQLTLLKRIQDFTEKYFKEHNSYPIEGVIIKSLKISEEAFRDLIQENHKIVHIDEQEDPDAMVYEESDVEESLRMEEYLSIIAFIDVDYNGILKLHLLDGFAISHISKALGLKSREAQALLDKALYDLQQEFIKRGINGYEDAH